MAIVQGIILGTTAWFVARYVIGGFYTVNQDERAVLTSFGRAHRVGDQTTATDPISESLREDERSRYVYPQLVVIQPGGPYFKWPWQRVHKVNISTMTANMAWDPQNQQANGGGTVLEAVTKDQLNIGLAGQIRWRVSDRNLYAFLFGVKNPIAHVMGYFVSILRERIANFEAPENGAVIIEPDPNVAHSVAAVTDGVSINDLRKNLRDINEHMDQESNSSAARYGVILDASLITSVDPPNEVDSALAAINTAHNHVSSDISLARASADQKIVQSRTAVEIETLKAQAEAEPLRSLAAQLSRLRDGGHGALGLYLRNARLGLISQTRHIIREDKN